MRTAIPFILRFVFAIWWGGISFSVGEFKKYEQPFVMQPSSISITSIIYNPSTQQSEWIRRVLGEEAIFHNRSTPPKSTLSLSPREKVERLELFRKHFRLPLNAMNPSCSFEVLGYTVADEGEPLTFASQDVRPAVGEAKLHLGKHHNESWTCYYRAMYDNGFMRIKMKPYHHWPVFFYCPAPEFETSCRQMLQIYRDHYTGQWHSMGIHDLLGIKESSVRLSFANFDVTPPHTHMEAYSRQRQDPAELVTVANENAHFDTILMPALLEMQLDAHHWQVPLTIDLFNVQRKPKNNAGLAVCLAIPYLSSSEDKVEVNGVLIFEFIRHYSNLGFKVLIYDRKGHNFERIFTHPYSQRFFSKRDRLRLARHLRNGKTHSFVSDPQDGGLEHLNFRYYNYTLLERLGGYHYDIRYENTLGLSAAVLYTDMDKQLTYTHCRFAAKNLYGIENVLVADFDEFLFCPRAQSTATAQRNFMQSYLQHMHTRGVEQLFVKQRVLVSKTPNMEECLLRQINATKSIGDTGITIADTLAGAETTVRAPTSLSTAVSTHPSPEEASIFHCLAPYQYSVRTYFDKSVLLGHVCPFTSYHYSSYKRQYDCFALSYVSATKRKRNYSTGGCGLVHITTRNSTYNRTHSHDLVSFLHKPNELYFITNNLENDLSNTPALR